MGVSLLWSKYLFDGNVHNFIYSSREDDVFRSVFETTISHAMNKNFPLRIKYFTNMALLFLQRYNSFYSHSPYSHWAHQVPQFLDELSLYYLSSRYHLSSILRSRKNYASFIVPTHPSIVSCVFLTENYCKYLFFCRCYSGGKESPTITQGVDKLCR